MTLVMCQHTGCTKAATRCPRFKLYASALYGKHPPIVMLLRLTLCDEHTFAPDDFLDGSKGWKLIEDAAKALGKACPVRERTEFDYATLEDMDKFFAGAKGS